MPTLSKFKKREYSSQLLSQNNSQDHISDRVLSEERKTYNIGPEFHAEPSKSSALIIPRNLLEHQDLINALIIAIKPRLSHIYFKRFTKEMIKNFFQDVRLEMDVPEQKPQMVQIKENMGISKQSKVMRSEMEY